jgi:hypothetical protein
MVRRSVCLKANLVVFSRGCYRLQFDVLHQVTQYLEFIGGVAAFVKQAIFLFPYYRTVG